MRFVLAVLAVSVCWTTACRRPNAVPAPVAFFSQPAIDFDTHAFDFGVVNEGTPIKHVFRVFNKGSATLELSGTATSCGCTAAILGATMIPPGGNGPIDVTMDTHGEHGPGSRTITVQSNDPRQPTSTLQIKYDVEPLLLLDRWYVHIGNGPNSKAVERVWLSGQALAQARLSVEVKGTDLVSARSIEGGKPGETRKGIQIELHAPKGTGPLLGDGVVTIKTGLPSPSELQLRIGYAVD
jgi:hypothetical protein